MSVNELRMRLVKLEEEAGKIRGEMMNSLPKALKIGSITLIERPNAVDVDCSSGFQWTHHQAQAARDWLIAAYPLDTAPDAGWVSVEERLPDATRNVLVLILDIDTPLVAYRRNGFWINYFGGAVMTANVTHWRELPAPPAAKGGSSE